MNYAHYQIENTHVCCHWHRFLSATSNWTRRNTSITYCPAPSLRRERRRRMTRAGTPSTTEPRSISVATASAPTMRCFDGREERDRDYVHVLTCLCARAIDATSIDDL